MSLVWVRAGQCGRETRTEALRVDMPQVSLDFLTTCEHVPRLSQALRRQDVAQEMSTNLLDTEVYRTAAQFVCRNSCVVPAAVLKALEEEANSFAAAESRIAFVDCGSGRG